MVKLVQRVRIFPIEVLVDRKVRVRLSSFFCYFSVIEPILEEGCKEDRDCPSKEVCIVKNNRGDCRNPCTTFTPCVANAECKVYDTLPLRTMTCTCLPGFSGKGDQLCKPIGKHSRIEMFY